MPEELTSEHLPFQELILDFSVEELAAINDSTLMTQNLFDKIFDKCIDIGIMCNIIFQKLMHDWEFRSYLADFISRNTNNMYEEKGE